MDNLTHLLTGLVVAEFVTVYRERRRGPSEEFRTRAFVASGLANNLPDGDFLLTRLTPGPLGYVLHHRGYTHTLLVGGLIGLAGFAVASLWLGRGGRKQAPGDATALALLWLAGPLLHVGLDFSNSYGVHAFWPFSGRWQYGDTLFIVEPWLWAVLGAPMLFALRSWLGRASVAALLAAAAVLPFTTGFVPRPMAVAIALGVLAAVALAWRARPGLRAALGLFGGLAVIAVFAVAGRVAEARVRRVVALGLPDDVVRDVVLSPLPGTPLCWYFSEVATTPAGEYAVRRGHLALLPGLLSTRDCALSSSSSTAPLRSVTIPEHSGVALDLEFVAPRAELVALARDNCDFGALLRFARLPYWVTLSNGELAIGDLRFDRSRARDLSELVTPRAPTSCPPRVPGWTPPRAELWAEE